MSDLIDRQAAIDSVQKYKMEHGYEYCDFANEIENDIKNLPSAQPYTEDEIQKMQDLEQAQFDKMYELGKQAAQPEPKWIPCSDTEDLPEHEVLCCDKYGEELIGWLSYSDDQWLCESDCEMMYDPIAWREKPEPWRGEE